jgi:hypothetical protein
VQEVVLEAQLFEDASLMSSSLADGRKHHGENTEFMQNTAYYTNIYPMVNKHNYGTSPFSIAMLVYQRVHCRLSEKLLPGCYPKLPAFGNHDSP